MFLSDGLCLNWRKTCKKWMSGGMRACVCVRVCMCVSGCVWVGVHERGCVCERDKSALGPLRACAPCTVTQTHTHTSLHAHLWAHTLETYAFFFFHTLTLRCSIFLNTPSQHSHDTYAFPLSPFCSVMRSHTHTHTLTRTCTCTHTFLTHFNVLTQKCVRCQDKGICFSSKIISRRNFCQWMSRIPSQLLLLHFWPL